MIYSERGEFEEHGTRSIRGSEEHIGNEQWQRQGLQEQEPFGQEES